MVVVKLSSFGRGRDSDAANGRYIARFGTMTDEAGRHISRRDALRAVDERMQYVNDARKSSFRVIISLPMENTEQARQIAEDIVRSRYGTYLSAFHETNDRKERQPHLHVLVFNDMKRHPLRDLAEIHRLRSEIDAEFRRQGVMFSRAKEQYKGKYTQAEEHMRQRGQHVWKDSMRSAIKSSMDHAASYDDFVARLQGHGITVTRATEKSVTFQDQHGHKARLNSLFSRMRSPLDIQTRINSNVRSREVFDKASKHLLKTINRRIEAARYINDTTRAEMLENLRDRISNSGGTLSDKWNAHKDVKAASDRTMPYGELREIEKDKFSSEKAAERDAARAINQLFSNRDEFNRIAGHDNGGGNITRTDTAGKSEEERRAIKMGERMRSAALKAQREQSQSQAKASQAAEAERQKKKAEDDAALRKTLETLQSMTSTAPDGDGGSGGGPGL